MLLSLLLKLLHSKKVLFKKLSFIFVASIMTSFTFALVTPDPVRVLGIRPRWCPDLIGDQYGLSGDEANSLTNICGQIFDAENEQLLSGLTVAVYELDPDQPTGHFEGRPNGLYASTYTDGAGRFHITARKVISSVKNNLKTSPLRLYVVIRCNNDTLASTIVKSFFDIYNLDHMPYVPTGKNCTYTPPPSEIHVANRGILLNADVGETGYLDDLPVGSTMEQDLVYNNVTGEEIHDIRYARHEISLAGITGYQTRGGMYERDCLHRYKDVGGLDAEYFCNFNDKMFNTDESDYLTRAAFRFLPRLCEDTTDRRFEFRGNMVRMNQDPLITARTYNSLFGTALGTQDYILTQWGEQDEGEESLIDCDCFLAANSVEPGAELASKCPERNNLLSGGPVSKMAGPFDFTPPIPGADYGYTYTQNRPLNIPICQLNGRLITVMEIVNCATDDNQCPEGITRAHYHPSLSPLLYVGDSYIGYSSYMHFDSKPGRYPRRESEFQIQTTAEQSQYNTGQAIPQEDGGYNARIQGINSPGSNMVMASPEIVQIHSNPNVTFADVLTGPFTPPEDYIKSEAVQQVYFEYLVTPYAKTSLPLQNRQIGRQNRLLMLLDNVFDSHADYWLDDGQGHTQNKTVHTPMYFTQKAITRDANLGLNAWSYEYYPGRDDAYENWLGYTIANKNYFRTAVDSIQTIISGRKNAESPAMPFVKSGANDGIVFSEGIAGSLNLVGNLWDVVSTTGDGQYKSYAHVDADAVESVARDELLKVDYELCRDNFTAVFKDPADPYTRASWGSFEECYPYEQVPASFEKTDCIIDSEKDRGDYDESRWSNEKRYNGETVGYCECDTWDEDGSLPLVTSTKGFSANVSRTCRVNGCYRITYVEVCDCMVQFSGVSIDPIELHNPIETNCRIERRTEPCDANDRLVCAASQVSCSVRAGGTSSWTRECAIDNTTEYLNEDELEADVETLAPAVCENRCDNYIYDPDLRRAYCANDAVSTDYLWSAACTMAVADHYICPAPLELGVMDGKIFQNLPFNANEGSKQKNTDQVNIRQHILDQSLQPPYEPKNGMFSASHGDWENTNAMIESRIMTWGNVYVNTGGSEGNTAQLAARATSPFPTDDVNVPLSPNVNELEIPIVYHVDDPGFNIREIDSVQTIMSPNRIKIDADGDPIRFDGSLQLAPGIITNPKVLSIFGTRGGKQLTSFSENYTSYIPPELNNYSSCDISHCTSTDVPAFSNTALNILNYAADRFKMPPAVLVAYMSVEGEAFNPPFYYGEGGYNAYLDDHLMDMWSKEYFGRIELIDDKNICMDTPWSAVGPGQWIKKWFTLFLHDDIACAELNAISPRRCNNASRCNFLDLTVVAAAHLDITNNGPATCDKWTEDHVKSALNAISGKSYTDGAMGSALSIYRSCN